MPCTSMRFQVDNKAPACSTQWGFEQVLMQLARRELIRFIAYGLDSCGTWCIPFLILSGMARAHHFRFATRDCRTELQ